LKNKRNILICGGTGFIGRNLVNKFSKNKNFKVTATYLNSIPHVKNKNIKWIRADLKNQKITDKITKNIDIIIQAAATTSGVNDIVNKPFLHVTDNVVMNSYLLRSAYENKIKHFIFFSCTVMYSSSKNKVKETDFNPSSKIYEKYFGVAKTKVYVEDMCKFYSKISNIKFTCIRHSNVYGPYDKYDLEKSHFFGATITKVLEAKKEVIIWGQGTEKRDLIFIEDLVNFVKLTIIKQKQNFKIYNCGFGKFYSINELTKKIIKNSKKNLIIKHDLRKPTIGTFLKLDCSQARKQIGWEPKTSIDSGILKTIEWYKKNIKKL
jgi:GDP-L-fucose synthase